MPEVTNDTPAVKTVYPSYRFHKSLGERRVESPADEEAKAPPAAGWVRTPADFEPEAPADPTTCPTCGQKLPEAASEAAPQVAPEPAPLPPTKPAAKK